MKNPRKPKPNRWLHLGISINADLRDRLHACARAEQRSVSFLVRSILEASLPELNPKKNRNNPPLNLTQPQNTPAPTAR